MTPIALLLVLLVAYFLIEVRAVLVLIVLSFLFATLIERPVSQLQRRHFPRAVSILIVYVVIIGSIGALSYALAPTFSQEATLFRREAPQELRELQRDWRTSDSSLLRGPGANALQTVAEWIEQPPQIPQEYTQLLVAGIGSGLLGFLTVFVITFYYLMEKQFLRSLILMQLKLDTAARVNRTWDNVEAKLGRWLRGQLVLMIIIGVTSTIAYGLLDVRFWPVLGLIAGLTEAIPILGPWLGGIPAVAIAFTQSWQLALTVAGVAVVIQLTENWVLVPRVMKGAVGLTPLTVFLAILVGAEFMGILGALLAIPIAAAIQVIVSDYLKSRRESEIAPGQVSSWRWAVERMLDRDHQAAPAAGAARPLASRASGRRGKRAAGGAAVSETKANNPSQRNQDGTPGSEDSGSSSPPLPAME
jgi:predicted PurR-regulated permease PerM